MQDTTAAAPVLAIACGGTGGHFYPGVTIALECQRRGLRPLLFIGGHHIPEQLQQARDQGLDAIECPSMRWPGNKLHYPVAAWHLWRCRQRNRVLLRQHGAVAALCMGSFASVPMGWAAHSLGLPLFVHEGNARMGRANRLLSRWAQVLFLSFPLRPPETTRAVQQVVGMPVRDALKQGLAHPLTAAERAAACAEFGLDPQRLTLLAFGGSQGAQYLNDTLRAAAALLTPADQARCQVLHLIGSGKVEDYARAYAAAGLRAHVRLRDSRMDRLYQLADLVCCRAGASTLFELALFGRPALLVPLPTAMDDHQTANASFALELNGAVAIAQRDLTPEALCRYLQDWLNRPDHYRQLGEQLRPLARPDAAADVAGAIAARLGLAGAPPVAAAAGA